MDKKVVGALRIALVVYTVYMLYLSGFLFRYPSESSVSAGENIGAMLGLYMLIAFWGNHLMQGIWVLRNKENRKVNYLTLPGFLFSLLLIAVIGYKLFNMFSMVELSGRFMDSIILLGLMTFLATRDFKILRDNSVKSPDNPTSTEG